MRTSTRLVALAGALLLTLSVSGSAAASDAPVEATPSKTTVVAPPDDADVTGAAARSCYGNKKYFVKKGRVQQIPAGFGWWKTTSNCQDINLRLNNGGRYVQVCDQKYACIGDNWTWAPNRTWTVIRSNVPSGTKFRFKFKTFDGAIGHAAY